MSPILQFCDMLVLYTRLLLLQYCIVIGTW